MRKIEYVVSNERLITPSGLSLVGQVLGKSNLIKKANRMRTEKRSQPQIKNGDILLTMIGLLSLGKSDFENVNEFHKDEEFYKIALGIAYGINHTPLVGDADKIVELHRLFVERNSGVAEQLSS